jgi:hypothetical protein
MLRSLKNGIWEKSSSPPGYKHRPCQRGLAFSIGNFQAAVQFAVSRGKQISPDRSFMALGLSGKLDLTQDHGKLNHYLGLGIFDIGAA